MTILYAVDPGKNRQAVAFFEDGVLRAAEFVALAEECDVPYDALVIERPQQDGRSRKIPPQDLIDLAWAGALFAGGVRAKSSGRIVEYTPAQWKGSVSKPAHHLQVWRALDDGERLCFPKGTYERIRKGAEATARAGGKLKNYSFAAHNLLDAAGLGLFHLKRIGHGGRSI